VLFWKTDFAGIELNRAVKLARSIVDVAAVQKLLSPIERRYLIKELSGVRTRSGLIAALRKSINWALARIDR
jgi:hypothetical protein